MAALWFDLDVSNRALRWYLQIAGFGTDRAHSSIATQRGGGAGSGRQRPVSLVLSGRVPNSSFPSLHTGPVRYWLLSSMKGGLRLPLRWHRRPAIAARETEKLRWGLCRWPC